MTPLLLLLGSLLFSLSFNISWAWGGPFLSVAAAAACTLIVPAGLHLWPQIPVSAPTKLGSIVRRVVRGLVMSGICVAAAVTSFAHCVAVLTAPAAGWADWTAWSVTGGAELLVALSTMALRKPEQADGQAAADREQALLDMLANSEQALFETIRNGGQPTEQPTEQTPDTPVPPRPDLSQTGLNRPTPSRNTPVRKLAAVHPDRSEDFREWVSGLAEFPSGKAIRDRYSIGYDKANALVASYRRELAEQGSEPAEEEAERAAVGAP